MPILRPKSTITESIAKVSVSGNVITAHLPEKREDFKTAVRALRLKWDGGRWLRKITPLAGDPSHRAAELVHNLLAAGFIVNAPENGCADMAISGAYEPECNRWILAGKGAFDGWLMVKWFWPEDDWKRANLLTGSRYDSWAKGICVPAEHYAEVQDFADMHGYKFSDAASDIMRKARKQREAMLVVDVAMPTPRKVREHSSLVCEPRQFADYAYHDFAVTTSLLPHQVPAVDKLLPHRIGAFFMEMGLGKTRCAIELAHIRRQRISRVLWYCPVSLKTTIAYEIHKHTDCRNVYVFDDDTSMQNMPRPDVFWCIIGIESMSSSDRIVLAANVLTDDNSFVIVDESSYIKGHNSKRTKRITVLSERARYRLVLTGTPISQGVVDLYAQMRFLDPAILGYNSFYSFAANHLEYHPDYPGLIVRAHNTDFLAAKIAPYIYQVTKGECLDLPDKLFDRHYYGLTAEQQEYYQQAKEEILLNVPEDDIDSYVIFQLFGALQQIVSGFWNHKGELIEIQHSRLDVLVDILERLPRDEKVIIWCKYIYSVKQIAGVLPDAYLYYGEMRTAERAKSLQSWRDGGRYLVITLGTGGHGLTLTEAAYAVYYEQGFKYSERIQSEDRIHRIGQKRHPAYIDIFARCGIEQRIETALVCKEDVAKAFRREVDKMKASELKNIVRTL